MQVSPPSLQAAAGGNITPFRIIAVDTAADSQVIQSTSATAKNVGICHGGTRRAPGTGDDDGYAAISGENVAIWGVGSIGLVELSGTSTRADALTSDGNGRGTTTTSDADFIVGIALQSGVANDLVRVMVLPGYRTQ